MESKTLDYSSKTIYAFCHSSEASYPNPEKLITLSPQEASKIISAVLNEPTPVAHLRPVSGGSINSCFKAETDKGEFFIKKNHSQKYPLMFEAEKKGLELLKTNSTFTVPKVYGISELNTDSFLVLDFLNLQSCTNNAWVKAGISLAEMHRNTSENFGLDHDNYIGSLHQKNDQTGDWAEFFTECRIEPLLKIAMDNKAISDKSVYSKFRRLENRINEIFPDEKPSLIHGDLWSGNISMTHDGEPSIFDPAVYFGHREMDIAMSKLFGGFSQSFYDSYNENFPLEKGWKDRTGICNLYPLLVHVILFGESYLWEINQTLKPF